MNEIDEHLNSLLEIESETIANVEDPSLVTTDTVVIQEGELVVREPGEIVSTSTPDTNHDLEYDYELSRETHRELIEQGKDALDKLIAVANESQHPRAYEVAGQLLKNLSDMTDKLMNLHEKKRKIEADENFKSARNISNVNVDKAVFVGTTAELLKSVKHESNQ